MNLSPAPFETLAAMVATLSLSLIAAEAGTAAEPVRRFLNRHCVDCHDSATREAGLDLTSLEFRPDNPDNLAKWVHVFDRVRAEEMPPPEVDARLLPDDVEVFLEALHDRISAALVERQRQEGRVVSRRLTRGECERSLHELLGVRVPVADLLPDDPKTGVFDRIADGQPLSPVLLERYLHAGGLAVDAALGLLRGVSEEPEQVFRVRDLVQESPWFYGGPPDEREGYAAVWNYLVASNGGGKFYGRLPATTRKNAGWHRITVRAWALHPHHGHVWASLHRGQCDSKAPQLTWVGWIDLTAEPQDFTFETWMDVGEMLHLRPMDDTTAWRGRKRQGSRLVLANDKQPEEMGIPGVAIERIEITPIAAGMGVAEVRRRLFGVPGREPSTENDIRIALEGLASRAWRRPVTSEDVAPAINLANSVLAAGKTPIEAWREGALAIVISPRFLYLPEPVGELDGYALANRLSAMLWSLPPDEALRQAARSGELLNADELHRQTERLLDDPRISYFIEDFTGQWLGLDEIDATVPDEKLYPEYDEMLKHSMLGETRAFFRELLDRDLPIRSLAITDFAMLNGRLAKHYGLPGPAGLDYHRVTLPADSVRGGLLGQAAILKVTANGTTTSPVLRGVWVLERMLGKAVPLPPPNVGSIEPDIRGAVTVREQLDKHRRIDSCAACHRNIDPPGLALESFDPVGAWRKHYRRLQNDGNRASWVEAAAVDASGRLPDGSTFQDIRGFRGAIARDDRQLARGFVTHLVAYGTAAQVSFADRQSIDAILRRAAGSDYGVRTLLHEVIQSELFRRK